ncbi:FG-GAP-like repeat-containing protein [Urbifossiella limnaea]|uniref:FG-GAP repeat protein n=1 Tax=Urbifossiella limnaea TaxID=2528023 RepID=A0A517XZW1_9BACT|nr:FG-GAP-like repeat-containing protein [Urbifossiella limnaea]QDU22998.1 FG-GAP repeat protein [Urbifossiella limnaea]
MTRQLRPELLEDRSVPAAVGALDPSFDTDGLVRTTFGATDTGSAVAVQPDGKVVVAGLTTNGNDVAVVRYNPDGSLDTSFDTDGKATYDLGAGILTPQITGLALQDDGKIVICGYGNIGGDDDFVVVRLNANGSADTTFSADGRATRNFAGGGTNDDQAFGVAVLGTGATRKIILVGSSDQTTAGTGFDFAVASFNDNGTTDTAFNAGGTPGRLTRTLGGTDRGRAVAIDSADRIVVAGFTNGGGTNDFGVLRVLPAGTVDVAFNGTGTQTVNFGADDQATSVAVRPDDRIVVGGFSDAGFADFAVAQLTATGLQDTAGFNPTGAGAVGSAPGRFTFNFGALGVVERANAIALQPDDKIVLAGFSAINATGGNPNDFAVARVTADGKLDTSFATDGRATADFGADDQGAGAAIDNNGRVVVAGFTTSNNDFAVARFVGSVEKGDRVVVGGSTNGAAQGFDPNAAGVLPAVQTFTGAPFGAVAANVRTAVGDVDGDGIDDAILVTGPGVAIRVAVLSGADGATLLVNPFDPFGGGFTGGGFVTAGDFDLDGKAEFIVTPDEGGGPRVSIFTRNADGTTTTKANFFGIDDADFRGGARAATGDVDGDGTPDLAVAAGFGGGPRVALFDGGTVFGTPTRIVGDFFAFPGTDAVNLRNGAFVAAGDVDGDGFADLAFGGGPGGAPRVFVLSGALVSAGNVGGAQAAPVLNFFVANDTDDRGGVRVALADLDGDQKADVLAGSGQNRPAGVRVYLGKNITGSAEPATFQDLALFGGAVLPGGVFVG